MLMADLHGLFDNDNDNDNGLSAIGLNKDQLDPLRESPLVIVPAGRQVIAGDGVIQ